MLIVALLGKTCANLAAAHSYRNVLAIPLQTVPLQSIMQELDKCFILSKGTVWRGITILHRVE